jgi:hypothetical protein
MSYIGLAVVASLLILVIVLLARRARPDTAGDFRRQIDALSSEARRPVVEQVHNLERLSESSVERSESPESPDTGEADRTDGP